jgi:CubicO group peptidase (beta-lactamase class C family)
VDHARRALARPLLTLSLATSLALLACLGPASGRAAAQGSDISHAIDAYIEPYVRSNNFSGQLLVLRRDAVLYQRELGMADREARRPMTRDTQLHIASISMQYTAAAVMRLIDQRQLSLDTRVSDIVQGVRGGERITIRHLLEQRSGLSDINARADYAEILQHHQTPASLVAVISGDSLLFEPGSGYLHEEHSAYNLLALIIEKRTGLPFARAMQRLVFEPAGLRHTAADDDAIVSHPEMVARGYNPEGVYGLSPATPIHWSAKSGNASVRSTAADEAHWVQQLFHGHLLSDASRSAIVDSSGVPAGYGWFRRPNKRFGERTYSMSGRAPGFASYVMYLPREDVTVVAFSNIYSSATADIGNDIAAIALGLPYAAVALDARALPPELLALDGARFTFPSDFYQPNATVALTQNGGEMFVAWPSGDRSPIIPLDGDHAIDRAYWEPIAIVRDSAGRAMAMTYDRFRGERASVNAADSLRKR